MGLTIETRPDFCTAPHLAQMLRYGCTRLEVGLQSIYEDVARDTNRGHTVQAVGRCFAQAKEAGFKVRARARMRACLRAYVSVRPNPTHHTTPHHTTRTRTHTHTHLPHPSPPASLTHAAPPPRWWPT